MRSRGVLLNPATGRPEGDLPGFDDVMTLKHTAPRPPRIIPISGIDGIDEMLELARSRPDIENYSRNKHYVGGRPAAATAATARAATVNLWNPHASSRIFVFEIWCVNTTATAFNVSIARSTARGTATTTVTPAAANSIEADTAAPSGFVLDLAWSAAPTIGAADLIRWNVPGAIGNGFILQFPDPLTIPLTNGIAVITPTALAFQVCDFTFVVGD